MDMYRIPSRATPHTDVLVVGSGSTGRDSRVRSTPRNISVTQLQSDLRQLGTVQ